MKTVFFGTPDFAVMPLEKLINSNHDVVAVVTQPDRPKGRSGKPVFSPVKEVALKYSVPVLQFDKIRKEGVEALKSTGADIFVTCAYGQILSREIIDIPPFGIINIHASLLPKYRGAAPIQWSILNGDKKTGVTIMKTEEGVDTGDIILQREIAISDSDTSGTLFEKLSLLGADAATEALDMIERGKAVFIPQDHEKATYVRMLKKEDGNIDWSRSAEDLFNFVRGMNPWPCAFSNYCGKNIKIWAIEISQNVITNALPGQILTSDKKSGITVATGRGAVKITELQLEGAKRMSAKDFLLGRSFEVGTRFSEGREC